MLVGVRLKDTACKTIVNEECPYLRRYLRKITGICIVCAFTLALTNSCKSLRPTVRTVGLFSRPRCLFFLSFVCGSWYVISFLFAQID